MRKVYKYATGAVIPDGAVYLNTVCETQEFPSNGMMIKENVYVWHYFLVEDERNSGGKNDE